MNVQLHGWRPTASITLEGALAALDRPLTGLCYSPNACFFVRWQGQAMFPTGAVAREWPRVYEARFFAEAGELRWQRPVTGEPEGQAVYISEAPSEPPAHWDRQTIGAQLSALPGRYLLRGERLDKQGLESGWYWLSSAAVGKIAVPLDLDRAPDQHRWVALEAQEYIGSAPGQAGRDGNRTIVEERWRSLTTVEAPK